MSIVFSAIVPHPAILVPQIGKENIIKLAETGEAFEKLADDLAASQADTILIISPHGINQSETFTMNLNPQFTADLEAFGDFSDKQKWNGHIGLAYKIREQLETKAPLQLVSEENLDYGSAIPLIMLTKKISSIKIIPLYYSGLPYESHFKFGQLLNRELLISRDNIAIIASGDLSHRVTKDAPAGYSPKGRRFDKKLTDLLLKNKSQDILNLDPQMVAEAGECGLRSILILLGIMDGMKHSPQLLSYEAPFGVGYLVMQFKL